MVCFLQGYLQHTFWLCKNENTIMPSALAQLLKLRIEDIIENTSGDKQFSFIGILAGRISDEYMKIDDIESMEIWNKVSQSGYDCWDYVGKNN